MSDGDSRRTELDLLDTEQAVRVVLAGQAGVAAVVQAAHRQLADAVELLVSRFEAGGRVLLLGAGTSGRLAVQEAVEVPGTYGVPPDRFQARVAGGGPGQLVGADQAEDDAELGLADLAELAAGPADVLIAVAASGSTPYTCAAARPGPRAGARPDHGDQPAGQPAGGAGRRRDRAAGRPRGGDRLHPAGRRNRAEAGAEHPDHDHDDPARPGARQADDRRGGGQRQAPAPGGGRGRGRRRGRAGAGLAGAAALRLERPGRAGASVHRPEPGRVGGAGRARTARYERRSRPPAEKLWQAEVNHVSTVLPARRPRRAGRRPDRPPAATGGRMAVAVGHVLRRPAALGADRAERPPTASRPSGCSCVPPSAGRPPGRPPTCTTGSASS